MAKFDSDYALFGTLAADFQEDVCVGSTPVTYANSASIELYGDLRGVTFLEIITEICGDPKEAQRLIDRLVAERKLLVEGCLSGKIVKYHSRIVDCGDPANIDVAHIIQAGITDITESATLKKLLYGTSEALKRAAKAADEDTGMHIMRINNYSKLLSELLDCDERFVEEISKFAQLHDIGKINVADIVRLPRKLTDTEFSKIMKHTTYGGDMIEGLGGLEMAHHIALEHHEKWDGSGYPKGKKGSEIFLEARIVAIADVFDALVSERPYKKAFSYEKTYEIIKNGDGRVMPAHFDPDVLRLFLEHYDDFVELHMNSKD
ncbi:HD-GYP domain-containing protein [Maridesulfovibrio frigidus]|uniref:HD-GYP domain-containing protein n=1 Tax=Maridesulfovibrio frigidus TaxID=340956 RepID=UPI00068F3F09|nr:HD domain-containing phosphohydrolase [Maridesulfovibrio frigidus]